MSDIYGALGKSFAFQVLLAHNNFRMCSNANPLILDTRMSKECQERALEILMAHKVENTRYPERGENIWIHDVLDGMVLPTGDEPVSYWYQHQYDWNFSIPPEGNNEGYQIDLSKIDGRKNFDQVICKACKYLGVGVSRIGNRIAVVCHYTPKGEN